MCSLQGLGVYSLYGLGAWGLRVWGAAEIAGAWGVGAQRCLSLSHLQVGSY